MMAVAAGVMVRRLNGYHGHFGLLGFGRATRRPWIRSGAAVLAGITRADAVALPPTGVAR